MICSVDNKKKTVALILLSVIIIAIVTSIVITAVKYDSFKKEKIALIQHSVKYVVPLGSSLSNVAMRLENDGIISNKWFFIVMSRLNGTASSIKAGEYDILPGMTPPDLLKMFVDGKVLQHSITIVEGWTFKQMLEAIHKDHILIHDTKGLNQKEIMIKLGLPDLHPEGRFYPDTYYFPRGTKDTQFLLRAYKSMEAKLAKLWQERSTKIPLKTPYDALILASIVERETAVGSERGEIAGVFTRRLKKRIRLQTDPTVIYGMGDSFNGDIRFRDLRKDTPYNTYTRYGLPPTPIALPSEASIYATLHPNNGTTLYFVSRGDGTHYFSSTLKEHNKAVDKYQRKRKKRK